MGLFNSNNDNDSEEESTEQNQEENKESQSEVDRIMPEDLIRQKIRSHTSVINSKIDTVNAGYNKNISLLRDIPVLKEVETVQEQVKQEYQETDRNMAEYAKMLISIIQELEELIEIYYTYMSISEPAEADLVESTNKDDEKTA